jgi:3-phosphoshikimate 1-carboxyvinyltransferase
MDTQGPLVPATIEVDGSLSSQFLTGLLIAYSASGAKEVSIKVKDLKSKPYVDLTLDVMRKFGMRIPENNNYKEFSFLKTPINQLTNKQINYIVEGDWSGAAFLLVAGAIAGPITIKGLDRNSTQADKTILNALMKANVIIEIIGEDINIHPGDLKSFEFDATDCPDLFPPLVTLAAYCKGETKIQGIHRLTHKESNRTEALVQEFGKMGVKIGLQDDAMIIHGSTKLSSGKVHSHHDHRIAMACAVAALKAEGEVEIEEAQSVKKSYPDFYDDLKTLGVNLEISAPDKPVAFDD